MLLLTQTWDPAQAEAILGRVHAAVTRANRGGYYQETADIDVEGPGGWSRRLQAWDDQLIYSVGSFNDYAYAATKAELLEAVTMMVRPGDTLTVHTAPSFNRPGRRGFWELKQLIQRDVAKRPWLPESSLADVPYGPDRLANEASVAGVDPQQAVYLASNLTPRPPVRRAYGFSQVQALLQQGKPRSPDTGLPFTVHDVRRLAAANVQKAAARLAAR